MGLNSKSGDAFEIHLHFFTAELKIPFKWWGFIQYPPSYIIEVHLSVKGSGELLPHMGYAL